MGGGWGGGGWVLKTLAYKPVKICFLQRKKEKVIFLLSQLLEKKRGDLPFSSKRILHLPILPLFIFILTFLFFNNNNNIYYYNR